MRGLLEEEAYTMFDTASEKQSHGNATELLKHFHQLQPPFLHANLEAIVMNFISFADTNSSVPIHQPLLFGGTRVATPLLT